MKLTVQQGSQDGEERGFDGLRTQTKPGRLPRRRGNDTKGAGKTGTVQAKDVACAKAQSQSTDALPGGGEPHQDGGLSKWGNWGGRVSGSPGGEADERKQTQRGSLQLCPQGDSCGRKAKEARAPHAGRSQTSDFPRGAETSLRSPSRSDTTGNQSQVRNPTWSIRGGSHVHTPPH